MEIDERSLDQKLIKSGKKPAELKAFLKGIILNDLEASQPSDLLALCGHSGLSPKDTQALYQIIYDGIEEALSNGKKKGPAEVSVRSMEGLVLDGSEQIKVVSPGYRLTIDPTYTSRHIFVSDTHIGSKHDNIEGLEKMFDRAVAIGAKTILHSGDLVDGAFAHRDMYLYLRDGCQTFDGQYERVITKWPRREGVTTFFIAGNHDHFFQTNAGVDICRHIASARGDMKYLKSESIEDVFGRDDYDPEHLARILESKKLGSGRVGAVRIGPDHLPPEQRNTIMMMLHPGDGSARTLSYKPQQIIKNLTMLLYSFENMTNPNGRRIKPHILQIGHYHKADMNLLRNVYVFQAGTMKLADEFHEVRNLDNMMGFWTVEITSKRDGDIVRLAERFEHAYVDPSRCSRTVVSQK
ncbi:metallophosphoesterase [Candidatus Woesearchaeota archaeon]|nr:metallophosphoesterase [Candidatus Woesearchaeota archaeon]